MKLPRLPRLPRLRGGVDPVTGDTLTAGERVSWMVQRIIRRWAFMGVIQLVTLVCWLVGTRSGAVLLWWNLGASDFAIVMEFLIGISMLGQTLRDANVTRTILRMEQQNVRMEEAHTQQLAELRAHVEQIRAAICAGAAASPRLRGPDGRFIKMRREDGEGVAA